MFNQIMIVLWSVTYWRWNFINGRLIGAMIISGRALAPVGQISQVLGRLNVSMECYRRIDEFMNVTNREEIANEYVKRSELKGPISTKNLHLGILKAKLSYDNLTLKLKKAKKLQY